MIARKNLPLNPHTEICSKHFVPEINLSFYQTWNRTSLWRLRHLKLMIWKRMKRDNERHGYTNWDEQRRSGRITHPSKYSKKQEDCDIERGAENMRLHQRFLPPLEEFSWRRSICKGLSLWPFKELVKENMPQIFKRNNPTTRVILDATEIYIKQPYLPELHQMTFPTKIMTVHLKDL